MRALYLLRHSLTEANEKRLYCGWADPPLSPAGRRLAERTRALLPLPECELYVSSGLRRANETLHLLTGHAPAMLLSDLREMSFGKFELRGYEELKHNADYLRWIEDREGTVACPGGESRAQFAARVARGSEMLLALPCQTALAVLHGGVIVQLMQAWFPSARRGFYDWQPAACQGYRVEFVCGMPGYFREI